MNRPKTLKAFSVVVDGRGYAGLCEEATLPKLELKTEEWRGGGMDAPVEIDMGMEKLEAELTFAEQSSAILRLWGLADADSVGFTLRGAIRDDNGLTSAVVVNLRGRVKVAELGAWKAGDKGSLKVSVGATYYRLQIDGVGLIEIDVQNAVRIVYGVDQLALIRAAIGV